jgi:hypothetical protein
MFLAFSTALMTPERIGSAKRVALGAVLVCVLWALAGRVYWFGEILSRQHQEQQELLRALERNREEQARLLRQNSETLARQRLEPKLHTREQRTMTKQRAAQTLTASALVGRLRQVNAFGLVANPERRLHCSENRGDWDYTCWFHPDPITKITWVQFGVLVDDAHVIEVSRMYSSAVALPKPLSLTSE